MDRPQLTQPYTDRRRGPSNFELLDQLKSTAWTCASINSSAIARFPPKLYVSTSKSQPRPKCLTQPVSRSAREYLADRIQLKTQSELAEVTSHPILTLFETVNPYMNAFDLWELTNLYQECIGSTYWYLETNALGRPFQIWPLPSQLVFMRPSGEGFTYYFQGETYTEAQIIHFRFPDPYYPYGPGLSPLRAAFAEARMSSSYNDLKVAKFDNRAAPDVIISPTEAIGEDGVRQTFATFARETETRLALFEQFREGHDREEIEIEAHATTALADIGVVPKEAARIIWEKGSNASFDIDRIDEIVTPGRTLHAPDDGYESPHLATTARRRN